MFNFNLKGISDLFQIGKKGPIVKKDGDKISFRNALDTDFVNGQALDPVDLQDVVTKQFFEDNSDLASFNTNKSLFKNLTYASASPEQLGTIDMPNLGLAYKVLINVKSAFNGIAPTLQIGESGNNNRLADIPLSNLKAGDVYIVTVSEIYSSATTVNAYLSPDSSTTGSIDVTVLYTQSEVAPIGSVLEEQLLQNTFFNTASGISVGQIFKHSSSFTITSIEVGLGSPIATPTTGSGTLKVYDGLGGTQIGESDAIDLSLIPDSSDFVTFNFSTNVSGLLANTEYWFEFDRIQVDPLGDLYFYIKTGGSSYLDGVATNNGIATGHDLKFKVIGV